MLFLISPGKSRKRNGCVAGVEDMAAVVVGGWREGRLLWMRLLGYVVTN